MQGPFSPGLTHQVSMLAEASQLGEIGQIQTLLLTGRDQKAAASMELLGPSGNVYGGGRYLGTEGPIMKPLISKATVGWGVGASVKTAGQVETIWVEAGGRGGATRQRPRFETSCHRAGQLDFLGGAEWEARAGLHGELKSGHRIIFHCH